MPTSLELLARFVAETRSEQIPALVRSDIVHRVMDTLGICLAACSLETSIAARNMSVLSGGAAEATVIGFGDRLPVATAAFVNGVLAHSLDFDDTHLPSVLHPSACVVPAALAVAEACNSTGEELVTAAALGYEVCIRTGMAGYDNARRDSVFFENGWHATSICGTLASAAVAARLMRLSAAQVGHAIAIAASFGSGILEGNRSGGTVKRLHCGWAVHAGINAAAAAKAGFTGPLTVFEGRFGFFRAFCGGPVNLGAIDHELGCEWQAPSVFFKPYPTNHFTHGIVDAALVLRTEVAEADVKEVEIALPSATLKTVAEPPEAKAHPQSGYHAKFSAPYVFAAAMIGGADLGVGLDDFSDENVRDPRRLALAAKARCIADQDLDAIYPDQFPARVTVLTHSGRKVSRAILFNRGGPSNPLTHVELTQKFLSNATRVLSREQAMELVGSIDSLPKIGPTEILALTTERARTAAS